MSAEAAAFLAAIAANPDDLHTPLVYADLLQERGDDARAEFIRVQCELAQLPPKYRELFVADGAGKRLEGLGVALTPRGGGHYSASNAERGLSLETFAPNERVDIYAHLARNDRIGWMRGLRYIKHVEHTREIIFRKDDGSGPWVGTQLLARQSALLAIHGTDWRRAGACDECGGRGGRYGDTCMDAANGTLCRYCGATGDTGGLLREFGYPNGQYVTPDHAVCVLEPVRIDWRRGFVERVAVPALADCVEWWCPKCGHPESHVAGNCRGEETFRPTPWLTAVLTATHERQVIREVVPLNFNTYLGIDTSLSSGKPNHYWRGSPPFDHEFIPEPILRHCADDYPTGDLAVSALGRGIVAWARQWLAAHP